MLHSQVVGGEPMQHMAGEVLVSAGHARVCAWEESSAARWPSPHLLQAVRAGKAGHTSGYPTLQGGVYSCKCAASSGVHQWISGGAAAARGAVPCYLAERPWGRCQVCAAPLACFSRVCAVPTCRGTSSPVLLSLCMADRHSGGGAGPWWRAQAHGWAPHHRRPLRGSLDYLTPREAAGSGGRGLN